ncbi:hypothetical protein pdam_00013290 [Pocillopora damicornis]|uniref:Uncharacterized protein n=1 Tax=Pocillopora damicornis TaxID=46731 RepID=A0A3M6UIG0_POCDA|nr:hypothetical protein pdam_00013290 [Pocillopora damicornis]
MEDQGYSSCLEMMLATQAQHLVCKGRRNSGVSIITERSKIYLTERKEPKKIGKRAIKTKLEYAINIPSGVAAALPVTFFAVSFTVAERFATVSFTTDSAIFSF